MPRQFKLLSQHYIDDRLLEAGKVIGEGTDVPFLFPDGSPQLPSGEMEGLDEASQAEVEAVRARGFVPIESLPTVGDAPVVVVPTAPVNESLPISAPTKGGKK